MVLLFAEHDAKTHRVLLEICIPDNERIVFTVRLSAPTCSAGMPYY